MIGIDIIEIERVEKLKTNLAKVFLQTEIEYFEKQKNNNQHIAGCFAAKESVVKAMGQKFSFLDIEVCHNEFGKPFVQLYNKTKKLFEESFAGKKLNVSISHNKTTAVAVCVII